MTIKKNKNKMRNIHNWEKFNELKDSTYRSAARKLSAMGHTKRAKGITDRLDEISANERKEKYDIANEKYGTFDFKSGDKLKQNVAMFGFDFGMMFDMYMDNEELALASPPHFIDKTFEYNWFNPFWLGLTFNEDGTEEKFGIDPALDDETDEEDTWYFTTRKDAVRFIRNLKDNIKDCKEVFLGYKRNEDEESIDRLVERLNLLVNKLTPNMIYRD